MVEWEVCSDEHCEWRHLVGHSHPVLPTLGEN